MWPFWLLGRISIVNRLIPGGAIHEIGKNTASDRDMHNLMDRFSPHLEFTSDEEARGEAGLRAMGIPDGAPFVCLSVRDSAYLDATYPGIDWSYHNYRDCDIENFVLTAEELASRGYFVIRMGAKVRKALSSLQPRVIDYATNGMRSDFMDVYLGAKCQFCISSTGGFDGIPLIFGSPIVYVNQVALVSNYFFRSQVLSIVKHLYCVQEKRELALSEIFSHGVGFRADYEAEGVRLIENTQEEIRDVVVEMVERLNGTWQPCEEDEVLQRKFWEIFPTDARGVDGKPLHAKVRARFGAAFLRNNPDWLQEPSHVRFPDPHIDEK